MVSGSQVSVPERVGAYSIYDEIGVGGMASVHLGKLESSSGFSRIVAIKRMHSELARSPEFVEMFLQEARLVGRIQHPNVVAALDCVTSNRLAMLVMEYVHGVTLGHLARAAAMAADSSSIPLRVASAIVVGAALGLHAAHEAVDSEGKSLAIVHRDVSPQNIIIGVDGLSRVLDFGIAKAAERANHTRTGEIKGKLGYMSPEQLLGEDVGRGADVYSLGVVLWELVVGRRLFRNEGTGLMMTRIAQSQVDSPRSVNPSISAHIDSLVMKALARAPAARYGTALEFAIAIERAIPPVGQRELGEWTAAAAKDELIARAEVRSHIETSMFRGWRGQRVENEITILRDNASLRSHASSDDRPSDRPTVVSRVHRRPQWAIFTGLVALSSGLATALAIALSAHGPTAGEPAQTAVVVPAPVTAAAKLPDISTPRAEPSSSTMTADPFAESVFAARPSVSTSANEEPRSSGNAAGPTRPGTPISRTKPKTGLPRSDGSKAAIPDLGAIGGRQ